jgi:hypothetical protein
LRDGHGCVSEATRAIIAESITAGRVVRPVLAGGVLEGLGAPERSVGKKKWVRKLRGKAVWRCQEKEKVFALVSWYAGFEAAKPIGGGRVPVKMSPKVQCYLT